MLFEFGRSHRCNAASAKPHVHGDGCIGRVCVSLTKLGIREYDEEWCSFAWLFAPAGPFCARRERHTLALLSETMVGCGGWRT